MGMYIKPTITGRLVDTIIATSLRHVAKKVVFNADNYISHMVKDLEATTTRCPSCKRLCRFNFDSILTSCGRCRTRIR